MVTALPTSISLEQACYLRFTNKNAMQASLSRIHSPAQLAAELFRIRPILLHPAHRFGVKSSDQTKEVLQYVDDTIRQLRKLTFQLYNQVEELYATGLTMSEIWQRVPLKMGFDLVVDGRGLLSLLSQFD